MDNSYRIKANIGEDQVLTVNLKQDIDIYEVLSLELKQENMYKLFPSDNGGANSGSYGVIVGRVLANDAFGVPNAKVTVFIPLSDVDKLKQGIRDVYPYNFVTDVDSRNVKFNALPNYKKFDCHQEVGSFPKKQLVLDEDTVLEVYDRYYKYTTVTNKAGDYMIFGVPTGEQVLHVDVDLSDIGIISQEPRDFIYKGYSADLFESPTQFKKGTNLDNLPQIETQNVTVTVYPLWGDKNASEIAITRKDINLQYKFETTCVFIGSVITDNGPNSISHNCIPDANVGEAGQLAASKGNIEMIRKTVDDRVEKYPIKGNQLIDGDGTWCYQIPMNLDYVGMDEYGNIIPTNNPNKGIPTRARVRFRFTLDENGEDDLTRHKARYLVPNNPDMYEGHLEPHMYDEVMDKDLYYEFGTLTPEDCFRDLYWNKVYSVKNYIPRIQMSKHEKSINYLAIKGVNKKDAMKNNPLPYNKLNLNISIPAYYMLYKYGVGDKGITGFWRYLSSYSIPYNVDNVREKIIEDLDGIGLDFYNDWLNGCLYFPSWFWHIRQKEKSNRGESDFDSVFCECKNKADDNMPGEMYLYNNCSLVYENDDLKIKTINPKTGKYLYDLFYDMYTSIPFGTKQFFSGIIKKKTDKDGVDAYYYTFGNKLENEKVAGNPEFNKKFPEPIRPKDGKYYYKYARLYSTDIILLGSLKDCDLDGVPKIGYTMPSTTSNIPPMGRYKPQTEEIETDADKTKPSYEEEDIEDKYVSHNGMNWGAHWKATGGFLSQLLTSVVNKASTKSAYKYYLGSGLFFGLSARYVYEGMDWATAGTMLLLGAIIKYLNTFFGSTVQPSRIDIVPYSDIKTCMNAERISELGVTLDSEVNLEYDDIMGSTGYSFVSEMDGLMTKREIENVDSRALFATLNFNKLIGTSENFITGYKKYDLKYFYPTNFDGRMGDALKFKDKLKGDLINIKSIAEYYTDNVTTDDRNKDYLDFKFGNREESRPKFFRSLSVDFDGKQKNIKEDEGKTVVEAENVRNGNYNKYSMNDGFVSFERFVKPKNRHFYGYKNYKDTVYPLVRNYPELVDFPYAFPLYDNSFYFYFGMNRGSTAIDKFYEKFYSECPDMNAMPFMMEVTPSPATACGERDGSIRVVTEEITFPYTVELWEGDSRKHIKEDVNVYITSFNGLDNGEYKVIVKDMYGTTLSEKVILKYQKIALETNVLRGILTEYIGQTCIDICDEFNNYYGKLSIDTYTLYGEKYNVSLSRLGTTPEGFGLFKIGNGQYGDIRMEIIPDNGEPYDNFVCTCTTEYVGNVIYFSKPGTFTIQVYEMCGQFKSDNVSDYKVTIPDTKRLEMYINNVPLKYIVGYNEDLIPYNKWFHNNGDQVTCIDDDSIKGWFGTHNPDAYDELFIKPLKNTTHKMIWNVDIVDNGNLDIIREKFNFMFHLSNGAYVTAGGKNKFEVRIDGADGKLLLRSAMPEYDKFSEFNTEKEGEFNSYLTNERNTATCNEFNPNIVSENYRYVNNKDERFPQDCDGVNGKKPILSSNCKGGCHDFYDFNPKYNDRENKAANYFAGFSNDANIVQITPTECKQRDDYKPYQVIPYKAHDLYKDGVKMCILDEREGILEQVYKPTSTTKRYFRTEFIDRRFDYKAFFITGHRAIHYDIDDWEENIVFPAEPCQKDDSGGCNGSVLGGGPGSIWDEGRISAITYNGIDMLYKEVNGDKLIISENDATEYKYTADTAEVKLDLDCPKRFYDSKLYYGDGKYVDLLDAFYYNKNTSPRAFYLNDVGETLCPVLVTPCADDDPIDDRFENFGFDGSGVKGYPSKRSVNYYSIPYGDYYQFHNVSCSYDGIEIEQTDKLIKAIAVPGEVVDFTVEACELINMLCDEFELDCKQNHYNIKYEYHGGPVDPVAIHYLPFKIHAKGSDGFRTKVEKLNVRACWDIPGHKKLKELKTAACVKDAENVITSTTVWTGSCAAFDTSEDFKKHLFEAVGAWNPSWQFINMFFDRTYYSQAADSLMKQIRVFNVSTIYNVSSFNFEYTQHFTTSKTVIIPAEEINVGVATSGEGESVSAGTVDVESEGYGWGLEDAEGDERYDYTEFQFTSRFLSHLRSGCLDRVCFRIEYAGEIVYYTLDEHNVGVVERGDGYVKYGVIWTKHKHLLEENLGDANIVIFMNILNEIKSEYGDGHMEFAFGVTIKGTSLALTMYDVDKATGGMVVEPDKPTTGGTASN